MIKNITLVALSCFVMLLTNSCIKEAGSLDAGPVASYSFNSSPAPVIAGIYAVNRQMDNTNTITFTVNVTVRGRYTIITNAANGVHFEAGGTFLVTGPQTITLYGRGIPVAAGNFSYAAVTGNSGNFAISFLANAPAAAFGYAGGTGACAPVAINGSYATGVALGAGNYVDITVNVTALGTYSIITNTANNIFFSSEGIFSATGTQVVHLTGNGTPAGTGTFAFAPPGGCSFSITAAPAPPPASFTYNGAPGNCIAPAINGSYAAGTALTSANTVVLGVNVTTAGLYAVTTNSSNGVTFSASGVFTATGAQTIILKSTNTPTAGGTFTYTPAGGCSFDIIYTAALPPATFTYNGAPGGCTAPVISGTFAAGTALTASSTITLGVNVTTTGLYSVTTGSANGVTFSASGVFSATGAQTITFTSNNTPAAAGPFTYTPSGGCSFSITYTGGGGGGGGDFLKCTIDGVAMDFSSGLSGALFGGGTGSFLARGYLGNARLDLELADNTANIAVGTYNKLSSSNLDKYCTITYWPSFITAPGVFWSPGFTNPNPFTVTIQTLTTGPNKITGIFSGDIFDASGGNKKVVTAGSFSITY